MQAELEAVPAGWIEQRHSIIDKGSDVLQARTGFRNGRVCLNPERGDLLVESPLADLGFLKAFGCVPRNIIEADHLLAKIVPPGQHFELTAERLEIDLRHC